MKIASNQILKYISFFQNNFKEKSDYYLNNIIILYAFCLPLSRASITFFTVLMFLVWLFGSDIKEKLISLQNSSVFLMLAIFIGFSYLSIFWTIDGNIEEGFKVATKYLRLILIPMIVIVTTLRKEYISKVITAFVMGMLVSEILSYGIFFELWLLPYGHGRPNDPTPFMHHLDYATFLTFTSLLLLNRFFNTKNLKLKAFYFIYFLFVTSNLFLNGGRTGHMAFAISIFVVGFVNIKNKFVAFISMLVLVCSIFYAAYNISPVFKQRFDAGTSEVAVIQSNSNSKYAGSFGQRLGLWVLSIDMIKDNPILGSGAGSTAIMIKDYREKNLKEFKSIKVNSMHNIYVEHIVMYGIVGLFLYLMIWFSLLKIKIKNQTISNLRVIFISVFCSASLVENIFYNQFPMSLFALFVSIFIIYSNEYKVESL